MSGHSVLNPIVEENSIQSEDAVFEEYDHDKFTKYILNKEEGKKDKKYTRLSKLNNSWYCSGKFLLVILCFTILIVILVMLVYNKII